MADVMDERVEIDLECAAGAEATRDGANGNLVARRGRGPIWR